ncbi:MAG: hypothetical protein J6B00_01470 [Alphaproteobacteria bacterium]|nr:hypothetical protein [Alphaproteobacteria bacterium]
MFEQKTEDEKSIKIPFVEGLTYPVTEICKYFKDFLLLTGFVSLICSIVTLLAGRSFFCGVLNESFCSSSMFSFVLSSGVMFLGFGFYVSRWMCIAFKGMSFKQAIREKCFKQDLKALLFVFLYCSLWAVVCFGVYFLNMRHPFSDWRKELAVFIGVSAIIIFVMVLLINFVIFFRFLQQKSVMVLKQTFWPIFDNIFKLAAWFLIYFLIFFSLLKVVFSYFISSVYLPIWVKVAGMEFFLDFIIFTAVAFFVLHFNYLSKCLFTEEK